MDYNMDHFKISQYRDQIESSKIEIKDNDEILETIEVRKNALVKINKIMAKRIKRLEKDIEKLKGKQ